jgi:DNA-binding transcriptional LysR family regulator
VRTFVITFAGLFVPGLLGWLNDLTAWAGSNGQRPFPDAHNLSYLLVSAVAAGAVTVVNALWLIAENASGKGLLRTPPTPPPPLNDQAGAASVFLTGVVAQLVLVVVGFWIVVRFLT